ncbi:MAG: hypothetical protein LUD03_04360 [Firmicutes bacterium]|nr:hypothetical protein [Bacillota bacterium]
MAREARKISPSGLYIVQLDGSKLFYDSDDKRAFAETAEKSFSEGGKIYACVMTDSSVKMVVKESAKGISATMKSVKVSYARYFNKAHQINGALFSGRFKSEPLETEADAENAAKNLDGSALISESKKSAPAKKAAPKPKSAAKAKAAPAKKAANPAPKPQEKPQTETAPKKAKKKELPTWLL